MTAAITPTTIPTTWPVPSPLFSVVESFVFSLAQVPPVSVGAATVTVLIVPPAVTVWTTEVRELDVVDSSSAVLVAEVSSSV